jgi:putative ABC transport system substrate-binding protein
LRRREFITLLGGAVAWPLAAHAQQPEHIRRIGSLTGIADDPMMQQRLAAFLQALQQLGWTDGDNVRVDYRRRCRPHSQICGRIGRAHAGRFLVSGTSATERLLQVTRTVPIVFVVVPDPVGSGFVARLSRPGGNATGFVQFEYSLSGKWLELLKEIAPGVTHAAVLRDPAINAGIGQFVAIARGFEGEQGVVLAR